MESATNALTAGPQARAKGFRGHPLINALGNWPIETATE
jgi:hypothetical protein